MTTTTTYRVTYAAAGCLPDGDPYYFETLEDAADAVADERAGICWMDSDGYREDTSMSGSDVIRAWMDSGRVSDPTPGSTYAWTIERLERADEPANASIAWVCSSCVQHLANGECGDCGDHGMTPNHGDDDEPLSHLPNDVTLGMFAEHHDDTCPAHYGERDVECECEVVTFSHDRCDGCNGLPGERHAVTVWNDTDPR